MSVGGKTAPPVCSDPPPPGVVNERWVLAKHPNGSFEASRDVELVREPIPDVSTWCGDGDVLVEVDTLSVDAFVRTMLNGDGAYHGGVPLGGTLPALGFGRVAAAGKNSGWTVGRPVVGLLGAQTHATVPGRAVRSVVPAVPAQLAPLLSLPPAASLGLVGLTAGLTAYVGTFYVCRPPRRGETVVVTAAAGAVGSVASQLARLTGARVVGIAGNKDRYLLDDLRLDGAVNYKSGTATLEDQLDELCPHGVDFVFDNVGGGMLDVLLERIRPGGRVVICGAVSQYDGGQHGGRDGPDGTVVPGTQGGSIIRGPSNYLKLAERGATMTGFNVLQYSRRLPVAMIMMVWLYLRGKVHMTEQIEDGIHSYPHALQKLLSGGNTGKLLVRVKARKEELTVS